MDSPDTTSQTNYELSNVKGEKELPKHKINNCPDSGTIPPVYHPKDIAPIKQKIEEVKNICVDNIDKVLERGEKIELLVDQSEKLQKTSHQFHKSARSLRNTMMWRKMKCYACLVALISFGIYVLAWIICGHASLKQCR